MFRQKDWYPNYHRPEAPRSRAASRRTTRLEFREIFRRFLRRQFPASKIAALSTEPDLEHRFSPVYPRALLKQGSAGIAAIAASGNGTPDDPVLSFGLLWLDYLLRRDPSLPIRSLILFLPEGSETTTCLRLVHIETIAANCCV